MALNFQDVIRDVHDKDNHALQISGTINAAGQATVSLLGTPTVMVGTPTLFAVVNTSAAGVGNSIVTINPRVDYIGLMSVSGNVNISNATLYAVVNTSAAGVGNSIVTVANPDFGINAGVNSIGFATVTQVNQPALVASSANIGSVSILGGTINSTLQTSTLNIGSVSVLGGVINTNLNAGVAGIGFATVNVVNQPALVASSAFIGLVTVANTVSTTFAGNITIDSGNVSLNAGINNIGFATVNVVNQPALVASSAFIGLVTVANTVAVSGTVAATQSGTWDEVGINDSGNSITVDNAQLSVIGTGTEAAAMRVTIATDSTGVLSVDDNGGSLTVDGTVAVTGVATEAKQDTQVTHLATIAGDTTSIQTAVELIDDTIYVDDADWIADISKHVLVGAVTQVATTANTDGDVTPLTTNAFRELRTAVNESDLVTAGTAHVKKYYTNAGAVTDGIIWSPAAGKRWFVTDLIINVSAAATVTLEDDKAGGDEAVAKFELAANSGIAHSFNTPWFSGEDAADLIVTTTAGNIYITITGYEI